MTTTSTNIVVSTYKSARTVLLANGVSLAISCPVHSVHRPPVVLMMVVMAVPMLVEEIGVVLSTADSSILFVAVTVITENGKRVDKAPAMIAPMMVVGDAVV